MTFTVCMALQTDPVSILLLHGSIKGVANKTINHINLKQRPLHSVRYHCCAASVIFAQVHLVVKQPRGRSGLITGRASAGGWGDGGRRGGVTRTWSGVRALCSTRQACTWASACTTLLPYSNNELRGGPWYNPLGFCAGAHLPHASCLQPLATRLECQSAY